MVKKIILGLICSSLLIVVSLIFPGIFTDFELKTYDYRMRSRIIDTDRKIMLLDIDNRSDSLGAWPWRRSVHAEIINILSENNAKAIAYDIYFEKKDNADDSLLATAVKNADNVYSPIALDFNNYQKENGLFDNLKRFEFGNAQNAKDIVTATGLTGPKNPIDGLLNFSKGAGHISIEEDTDGVIRRVPLIVNLNGKYFPSFALSVVMGYLNIQPENIIIYPGDKIVLKNAHSNDRSNRDIAIPIDNKGKMLIHYAGGFRRVFKTDYVKHIFDDYLLNKEKLKRFEDKIVFLTNRIGNDYHTTPIDNIYPGGWIHAEIVNTILTGNFLQETSRATTWLFTFILGIAGVLCGFSNSIMKKLGLVTLLLGGFILTVWLGFILGGYVITMLLPVAAGITGCVAASFYREFELKRENRTLIASNTMLNEEYNLLSEKKTSIENEIKGLKETIRGLNKELSDMKIELDQEKAKVKKHLKKIGKQIDKTTDPREKENLEEKYQKDLAKLPLNYKEELINKARKISIPIILSPESRLFEILDQAENVAKNSQTVVLRGETGVGKELFARYIHEHSDRKNKKMIKVNCATLVGGGDSAKSELFGHKKGSFTGATDDRNGSFMEAQDSTIFLDEIGRLPWEIQGMLLAAIEDKEIKPLGSDKTKKINARIIAATSINIEDSSLFMSDLNMRLKIKIYLPSLRNNKKDIPVLVSHMIRKIGKELEKSVDISQDAIDLITKKDWPGNTRELENILMTALTNLKENKTLDINDINDAFKNAENPYGIKNKPVIENADDDKDETEFLELLRKHDFIIERTQKAIMDIEGKKIGDNHTTNRFREICFKYLSQSDGDLEKAAIIIAGGKKELLKKANNKIYGYHESLLNDIKYCNSFEEAIEKCFRPKSTLSTSFRKDYRNYVHKLIEIHLDSQRQS